MIEHVSTWLEAYHDGELRGRRLQQVETHLEVCSLCRAELERLQHLSSLLQESPAAEGLIPVDQAVAQVGLRLPRRPAVPAWQRALESGWQLTPVLLLAAWTFMQTVFLVTEVLLIAVQLGFGGDALAGLLPASPGGPRLTELFGPPDASLADLGRAVLHTLGQGGPWGWDFALRLALPMLIGLMYWSWLASWWARRRHRSLGLAD